jgi:carbamoyl-phosphate synthase large subunit
MTIRDEDLIDLGSWVAEAMGVRGPATVQCFRTAPGRHEVTDVNPRFGGAFPLPLAAGGAYPSLALALARGEQPEPRLGAFREGVLMTRFFSGICLVGDEDGRLEPLGEVVSPGR